jgi:hypothetical protein
MLNCRAFDFLASARSAFGLPVNVAQRPLASFCESRMLSGLTQTPCKLFHDLEDSPLAVTRCRACEQCANGMDSLAGSANHTADIAAPKLQLEDSCSAAWNFGQHHIVRKLNQLPDDELEKFSHASEN